jgi:hypothetical protein
MKCIEHIEVDAVSTCVRCGAGLCQECAAGTIYQIDNKPLCRKCNYEVGCENDRLCKSTLRAKLIKLAIFSVTFIIGLIAYFSQKERTFDAVVSMLFFWGLGFIGNFFDKTDTRSVKAQTKDALWEHQHPIANLVGKILGFFVMAVSSPIQIIALLIGIGRVKKQHANNTALLNRLGGANA